MKEKKVQCLGCGETYLIRESRLREIDNEESSPEGYCATVQQKVGFIRLPENGTGV